MARGFKPGTNRRTLLPRPAAAAARMGVAADPCGRGDCPQSPVPTHHHRTAGGWGHHPCPKTRGYFLPSSSSATALIEVSADRSVGSGTGANVAEWFDGTGMPVRSASAKRSGAVAPTHQMQIGTW